MTIQCSKCSEIKKESEFGNDSRTKSGFTSQCKSCNKALKAKKIQCTGCDKEFRKDTLTRHQKVCKGSVVKLTKGLKSKPSNAKEAERVECSCKHKRCVGLVSESVAYRHLRYGQNYWDALDESAQRRKLRMKE